MPHTRSKIISIMRKIIYLWNRLYYGLFLYNSRVQITFYKTLVIIPIRLLNKIGIQKKHKNVNKKVVRSLTDERISVVVLISDAMILALTALIVWTIVNFISLLIPSASLALLNRGTFMVVTAVLITPINYLFLWQNDKYLKYFKLFRNASPSSNRIWSVISISTLLFALLMFILSMHLM